MMPTSRQLRCMTCGNGFAEGDPGVFKAVAAFDDVCICWSCVKVYRKQTPPDPSARE